LTIMHYSSILIIYYFAYMNLYIDELVHGSYEPAKELLR
jgi:hypothetical protein